MFFKSSKMPLAFHFNGNYNFILKINGIFVSGDKNIQNLWMPLFD